MLVSISYHTIDGEISSVAYEPYSHSVAMLTDALGSVVRTQDDYGGANFRYYAYGGLMKTTPGYLTPYIGWVGSLGYRETNLDHAEQYIRARHYSSVEARWTTVDPLWPRLTKYSYCAYNPINYRDPLGLAPVPPGSGIGTGSSVCVSITIPIPNPWDLELNFAIQVCIDCFACHCPKPPNDATRCIEYSGGLDAQFKPLDIGGIDLSELSTFYKNVFSIITGTFFQGLSCLAPKPGCAERGDEGYVKICAELCLGFVSLGGCIQNDQPNFSSDFGYCGEPEISVSVSVGRRHCY